MKYKIKAVSKQVREYDSKYGPMKSYKVAFEDYDQAVEISRKDTSPAPQVGDELEGTIDMSGQYGPKFKQDFSAGKKSFGGGYSRDDDAIKAQWAIGQAMNAHIGTNTDGKVKLEDVEVLAKKLFSMVERVKQPAATVDEVFPVTENVTLDENLFNEVDL